MGSSYRTKPDPAEPWRYRCPDCENQVYRGNSTERYNCQKCGESFDKDELDDLTEKIPQ